MAMYLPGGGNSTGVGTTITIPDNLGAFQNDMGYVTEADVDKLIKAAIEGIKAGGGEPADLSTYALKTDIPDVSTYALKSDIPDTSAFLTEHQDISNLATKDELEAKADKTAIPSLTGYAKTTDVTNSLKGYAKTSDIPSLTGYAKETYVDEKVSDALTNISDTIKLAEPDGDGNIIVNLQGGATSGKINLDVQSIRYQGLKGKKVSLLGDSITTFAGWLAKRSNGNEFEHYYPTGNIQDVEQTWWKQLINKSGMELLVNGAFSGSTVSTGRYTAEDQAWNDYRINALAKDGKNPDIIVVMIGINDFGIQNPVGSYDGSALPSADKYDTFSDAYALMTYKLMNTYKDAEIYLCTLPVVTGNYDKTGGFPSNQAGGTLLSEYNEKIRLIARVFNCHVIEMANSGINYFNASKYMIDGLHPNAAGAKFFASTALAYISSQSRFNHSVDLPDTITINLDGEVVDPEANITWYTDYISQSGLESMSVTTAAPYAQVGDTPYTDKPVNIIKFAVAQAGKIAYGKVKAGVYTSLGTLNVSNPSKTPQIFEISEVTLGNGERFTIAEQGNDGQFYYTKSSMTFNTYVGTSNGTATGNLSIDYGYDSTIKKTTPDKEDETPAEEETITMYTDYVSKSSLSSEATVGSAGYSYTTNEGYVDKEINCIKLAVSTAGTLTYGKFDGTTYTTVGTLILANPSKTPQIVDLPQSVTCTGNERFVVGKTSDTGKWWHSGSGGDFTINIGSGKTVSNTSGNNLAIDFGYKEKKTV